MMDIRCMSISSLNARLLCSRRAGRYSFCFWLRERLAKPGPLQLLRHAQPVRRRWSRRVRRQFFQQHQGRPAFGCPSLNIGSRPQGLLRGGNVLDVPCEVGAIKATLSVVLWDEGFRTRCREGENPYGGGSTDARIGEVLAAIELVPHMCRKSITY